MREKKNYVNKHFVVMCCWCGSAAYFNVMKWPRYGDIHQWFRPCALLPSCTSSNIIFVTFEVLLAWFHNLTALMCHCYKLTHNLFCSGEVITHNHVHTTVEPPKCSDPASMAAAARRVIWMVGSGISEVYVFQKVWARYNLWVDLSTSGATDELRFRGIFGRAKS